MLRRFKIFIRRFTQDHVVAPTIEYTIVLVLVLAIVITLAAHTGVWVAEKWAVLMIELRAF